MGKFGHCYECDKHLGGRTRRFDKLFCNQKCKAKYYRKNGATGEHKELDRNYEVKCEVCDEWFEINDYAIREGNRQALYCSGKCRQKAYRARKKLQN